MGRRPPVATTSRPRGLADAGRRIYVGTGTLEEVGFLGPPGQRVVASTHLPAGEAIGGLVICSPLYAEFLHNYRKEVIFARSLADAGLAVRLLRTAWGWALVDWESTETGVPPFFDPFHFLVQSRVELRRPTKRAVIDGLGLRGWAGARVEAYAAGCELDPREAKGLFGEYLGFSAARVSPSAPHRALGTPRKLFHLIDGTRGAAT